MSPIGVRALTSDGERPVDPLAHFLKLSLVAVASRHDVQRPSRVEEYYINSAVVISCSPLAGRLISEARRTCEFFSIVFNPVPSMPSTRFEPSSIKNKAKRQEIVRKLKREKGQRKLQSRLAIAKAEIADPAAKKVRRLSSHHPGYFPNEGYFEFRKGWHRMSPRRSTTNASSTPPS